MLLYQIEYGSRTAGSDIDILQVFTEDIPYETFQEGRYDVINVGLKSFQYELNLFDIIFTEPVLTGRLIYGSHEDIFHYQEQLLNGSIPDIAVKYLYYKGKWLLEQTTPFIHNLPTNENSRRILANIMFASSYHAFALSYSRLHEVRVLKELLKDPEYEKLITPSRKAFKEYEKSKAYNRNDVLSLISILKQSSQIERIIV